MSRPLTKTLLLAATGAFLVGVWWYFGDEQTQESGKQTAHGPAAQEVSAEAAGAAPAVMAVAPESGESAAATPPVKVRRITVPPQDRGFTARVEALSAYLDELHATLATGGEGRARVLQHLDALARALRYSDPDAVQAAISAFLESGRDAATGWPFRVGDDGHVVHHPTLRSFLLDQMGRISAVRARSLEHLVFDAWRHPAEWAVALRNEGWAAGGESRGELSTSSAQDLRDRWHQLMDHAPWLERPDPALLASFDVPVFAGADAEVITRLAALTDPVHGPALNHAAWLALDRLAARDPAVVLPVLRDHPVMREERPATLGSLVARADPRDPAQVAFVEGFLSDPSIPPKARERFLQQYPQQMQVAGPTLLTDPIIQKQSETFTQRRAALGHLDRWAQDPEMAPLQGELNRARERLEPDLF